MRRSIRLLLLVVVTLGAGIAPSRPASACSCMELDPTAALGEYEAAFVGTLVDVDGQVGAIFDSAADTIYRFEVETWVKGDLGDVVEIHSAASGASCGIEVGIGGRIGIFVRIEAGEFHSSLCETIDADVLLAAAEPMATDAPGPAALLLSAPMGKFDYVAINSEGGIVDGLPRRNQELFDRVWQFSRCPDSDLIVELWSGQLVVRDLADLDVVREIVISQEADLGIINARCMNADASSIWVAAEKFTGSTGELGIYDATDGFFPIFEVPGGRAELGLSAALILDHSYEHLLLIDYESGAAATIHEVERAEEDDYVAIASVDLSPDESMIAAIIVDYDPNGRDTSTAVTLFSRDGSVLNRIEIDAEGWWVSWIDESRLLVHTSNPDYTEHTGTVLAAPSLETVVELDRWQASDPVLVDDTLHGSDGGTLLRADLATGEVTEIATYPVQYLGPIAVLPEDFEIGDQVVAVGPAPAATVPPAIVDLAAVDQQADAAGAVRVVLVMMSIIATVVVVTVMLRRREARRTAVLSPRR